MGTTGTHIMGPAYHRRNSSDCIHPNLPHLYSSPVPVSDGESANVTQLSLLGPAVLRCLSMVGGGKDGLIRILASTSGFLVSAGCHLTIPMLL